jgi:hypothetical protein
LIASRRKEALLGKRTERVVFQLHSSQIRRVYYPTILQTVFSSTEEEDMNEMLTWNDRLCPKAKLSVNAETRLRLGEILYCVVMMSF